MYCFSNWVCYIYYAINCLALKNCCFTSFFCRAYFLRYFPYTHASSYLPNNAVFFSMSTSDKKGLQPLHVSIAITWVYVKIRPKNENRRVHLLTIVRPFCFVGLGSLEPSNESYMRRTFHSSRPITRFFRDLGGREAAHTF